MRVGEEGGSAHRIWLDVLFSGLLGVRAGAGTPKALGAAAWAHPQGGKKNKQYQNHPMGAVSDLFFILPAAISFFRS